MNNLNTRIVADGSLAGFAMLLIATGTGLVENIETIPYGLSLIIAGLAMLVLRKYLDLSTQA